MRYRLLCSIISILFLAAPSLATWKFNPFTGKQDYYEASVGITAYTVATLPAAPSDGDTAVVTDGADAADCTTGAGTTLNVCVYDAGGAAWVIVGDGAGSGNAFSTHDAPNGTDPVASGADTLTWLDGEAITITGDSAADSVTIAVEDATTTNKGVLEIATDAEAIAVTETDKAIVPSNLDDVLSDGSLAGSFTTLGVAGDITTTATAIDWDLLDNNVSALSFDAAGKAGIINILTSDSAEGVTMSGYLTVTGVLTQGSDAVLDAGTVFTGGDISGGTYNTLEVNEAGVDILSLANLSSIATSTGLGIPAGTTYTTISNTAGDDTINEYLAAIDTALANVLDGSTSFSGLTASGNLDIGAHSLTALTFASDQTTGTAPFTVASTTVVTNLNADTVDGESASAIVTAARVGTASASLDDTDATVEWEDATAFEAAGQLTTTAAVGDVAFSDLDTGDNYTNFAVPAASDDTIDELFAAVDATFATLSGDVLSVGDCTEGACLDGTSDGGTEILFYDAQGATTLVGGDTAGAVTLTLPITTGTMVVEAEVLELDNTDAFTPDADYEPATKKYVDDNVAGGSVVSVGDDSSAAALDGTSDAGTWIKFYDAQGATQLIGGDTAGVVVLTLPVTTGTIYASNSDGELDSLAGLTSAANKLPYFTGSGTADVADFTAFGRSIVDDADEATFKATVNLEIGTDVEAADFLLNDISDLADPGAARILYWNNTTNVAEWLVPAVNVFTVTEATNTITIADNDAARTAIGLAIGSDVQAYDANLDSLSSGSLTTWVVPYSDGSSAIAELALGADNTIMISTGAAAAPEFRVLATTDIPDISATYEAVDAEIARMDTADTVGADWEWQDDIAASFGNDNDWQRVYDETTDDRLEYTHTAGAGADVYWDLNDNAADSTYTITNSDATYEANLVVEGSATFGPTGGESRIDMNNNTAAVTGSTTNYSVYFYNGEFTALENGVEVDFIEEDDAPIWTGTTHSFAGVTNFVLPTASADASGEISISAGNELTWHDGTKVVTIDTTPTTDDYVLKYDNATATFTLEADETGGTPAWNSVTAPTADVNIIHDINEETQFTYTGAFTTGTQFNVEQLTGNPTGGVLFAVKVADSNVTAVQIGDGTNLTQFSQLGAMTFVGTGSGITPLPPTADGAAIGSAAKEFSDIYLADSAVIYGEADSSNTLTSSATGWEAALAFTALGLITGDGVNPEAATDTLGTATAEWGGLFLGDSDAITMGADQDFSINHEMGGSGGGIMLDGSAGFYTTSSGNSPYFSFENEDDDVGSFWMHDNGTMYFQTSPTDTATAGLGDIVFEANAFSTGGGDTDIYFVVETAEVKKYVQLDGTNQTVHFGVDDDAADDSMDIEIHDGGTIKIWDTNDDAGMFVLMAVTDGTDNLALTGDFDVSGAITGTTITGTGKLSTTVTTEQLRLNYDATNYATWTVDAEGAMTVTTVDADAANANLTFSPDGTIILTPATDVVGALTAGSITSDAGVGGTTITASTGFALGDTDWIGITGNEIITFNAAGSIAVTGATMDVDGAFTASTLAADTTISGTAITGTSFVIGSADISEAELEIIDGATVTTAELNILDTVTATAAELNYLDIATLGTGVASKAVVLDGSGNYTAPAGTWNLASVTGITLRADEIETADIATDAVTMDAVDADGDFETLTGDWYTTGTLRGDVLFNTYAAAQTLTAAVHNASVVQMTVAGEVTMWDCETANVGEWVTLWARDAEKIEVVPASGDHFNLFVGTALTADYELDMPATAGNKMTLLCTVDDTWSVYTETETSTDGGVAD